MEGRRRVEAQTLDDSELSSIAPTAWGEWSRVMTTAQLTPSKVGIHNVLIATDFSRYSNTALLFGLGLARDYKADAYVTAVVPATEFMLAGAETYVAAKEATRRDLLELRDELSRSHSYVEGKDYHLSLLEGDVARALLDFAREHEVDLIVVSTHGRSGVGKLLMGSVAENIFRHSPVPVLTIGPHVQRSGHPPAIKNILLPVDFSRGSERAVHYACALARERSATITALHVLEPGVLKSTTPDRAHVTDEIKTWLTKLVDCESSGTHYSLRVESGRVQTAILHAARETAADLVIMGVRPWNGILDRLMWPHAYEVVRESSCPVITVRQ